MIYDTHLYTKTKFPLASNQVLEHLLGILRAYVLTYPVAYMELGM